MDRRKGDPTAETPLTMIVLSGGTGRTAETVIHAALAQFDHPNVRLVRHVGVRSVAAALKAVREASASGGVICHALVDPQLRDVVIRATEGQMVTAVDVLGPALAVLTDRLDASPKGIAGLSYALNKEQFDRMDAVDFTLTHDDGARLNDIDESDVVLVGVSRVAKSVTCFYLAYRGIRAANVPIILGNTLPPELLEVDKDKVIGLLMNTQRLQAIRLARLPRLSNRSVDNYVEAQQIAEELRYANQAMSDHGWRRIDVSYKAVEEVAVEIVKMIRP